MTGRQRISCAYPGTRSRPRVRASLLGGLGDDDRAVSRNAGVGVMILFAGVLVYQFWARLADHWAPVALRAPPVARRPSPVVPPHRRDRHTP